MSGAPLTASTVLDRVKRQRDEARQAQDLDPLPALLLPLATALARLAARLDVEDAR